MKQKLRKGLTTIILASLLNFNSVMAEPKEKPNIIAKHVTCGSYVLNQFLDGMTEGYCFDEIWGIEDEKAYGISRKSYHTYNTAKNLTLVSTLVASRFWKPEKEDKKKLAIETLGTILIGDFLRIGAMQYAQTGNFLNDKTDEPKWELQITNGFSFHISKLPKEYKILEGLIGFGLYGYSCFLDYKNEK